MRGTTAHMARRDLFTSGLEMEKSELISRKEAMRESAERISQNKRVSERVWWSNTKVHVMRWSGSPPTHTHTSVAT